LEKDTSPDQFKNHPTRGPNIATLSDMTTRDTFNQTIQQLGIGKSHGPDGIPNEIIKYLPIEEHTTIFSLMTLLAKSSYTPPKWC
jgi:hypothetical protein